MKRAIRNWRHSPPFRNNGFHAEEEEGEGGILARLNRIRVKYDYLALPPPLCRASGRDSPRSNEPPESFRRPLHCDTASPPRRPPVFSTSLCSCVSGLRAIPPDTKLRNSGRSAAGWNGTRNTTNERFARLSER